MTSFFILSLSAVVYSLDLRFIQNKDALCLDGSQASYYIREGFESGANKYFIHLQGGAYIEGLNRDQLIKSAYERSLTYLGSSKPLSPTYRYGGIFSEDKTINPYFYNWNVINLNYCDGTGFQGHITKPVDYNGVKLYFRGDIIYKSFLQDFIQKLSKADKVVLSGCSAGAVAVYYWIEYTKSLLPANVDFVGAPDSGIFPQGPAFDGSDDYSISIPETFKLVNAEVEFPAAACNKHYPGQEYKCFNAGILVDYINVPIYAIQSFYDTAIIQLSGKIQCANDNTLTKCSQAEKDYIEQKHREVNFILTRYKIRNNQTGTFGISCLQHCFLIRDSYYAPNWVSPYGSGQTLVQAFANWVQNTKQQVNEDTVYWPDNKGCSNVRNNFLDYQLYI